MPKATKAGASNQWEPQPEAVEDPETASGGAPTPEVQEASAEGQSLTVEPVKRTAVTSRAPRARKRKA